MKYLLIALVLMTGCVERGTPVEVHTNGDFVVEFLFEKDGCKMYRFRDGNTRYIYWANCSGKVNADYKTSTGKSTTTHRQESITTE